MVAALRASPSLRGSGLKSISERNYGTIETMSPSLRGSGLKFGAIVRAIPTIGLPLYEGVD